MNKQVLRILEIDGGMASVGPESVFSFDHPPPPYWYTRKGIVRESSRDTIVSKLPKNEQSAPRGETQS